MFVQYDTPIGKRVLVTIKNKPGQEPIIRTYERVGSNSLGPTFKSVENDKVTGRASALHLGYIMKMEPVK